MKLHPKDLESLCTGADAHEIMQEFFDDSRHADSVPLDEFCAMGGAPDPDDSPEIHVNGAEVAGKYCTGTLTAYFNEVVYGGGCPDMPTVKPRQGDVSFTVVLDDGTVQFERDYDPR